jgi:hypothetical protein
MRFARISQLIEAVNRKLSLPLTLRQPLNFHPTQHLIGIPE